MRHDWSAASITSVVGWAAASLREESTAQASADARDMREVLDVICRHFIFVDCAHKLIFPWIYFSSFFKGIIFSITGSN